MTRSARIGLIGLGLGLGLGACDGGAPPPATMPRVST